jgi:hypothetical protein
MTSCIRCHRPLTDPASIQAGMGRICRQIGVLSGEFDMFESSFSIAKVDDPKK